MMKGCPSGTAAITVASKTEPYYACPSKPLAEYTNFVIGMASMAVQLTGHLPNISPVTGDPEYLDGAGGKPNQTRIMLAFMRNQAKVQTFDEAVAMCSMGRSRVLVTVMNEPKDSSTVWVFDDKKKLSFWMPKSSLDKR